jgi:hypothetical protein
LPSRWRGGRSKRLTLDAEEFLRRFVQHVLPQGFVKIRHYGLLANAQREARLNVCRRLLLVASVAAAGVPGAATRSIEPAQSRCCPECGSTRLSYRALAPVRAARAACSVDSS